MEAGTTSHHRLEDDRRPAAPRSGEVRATVAVRHKVDGDWRDVTFAEVGEIVSEIAAA